MATAQCGEINMARLNIERQEKLEPTRVQAAKEALEALGYEVTSEDGAVKFFYKGNQITYWAYSGWHSGKGIVDGRGLKNLLKQLK